MNNSSFRIIVLGSHFSNFYSVKMFVGWPVIQKIKLGRAASSDATGAVIISFDGIGISEFPEGPHAVGQLCVRDWVK